MASAIQLGNGKRVRVGDYVRAFYTARAHPTAVYRDGLDGWGATGAEVAQQMREHLTTTVINRKGGLDVPAEDWETRRLAGRVNGTRVQVRLADLAAMPRARRLRFNLRRVACACEPAWVGQTAAECETCLVAWWYMGRRIGGGQ